METGNMQVMLAMGIFFITYGLIVSEKIHRTVAALTGAVCMIVFGVISQEQALRHVDFNTLGLLTGMMIIVTITGDTGLFRYLAIWTAKKVNGDPIKLLVALGTITAVCSALLDNVTTVMLMVPITISITRQLKLKPMPYLISQIIASNIGGTATLIGDPPNIMIGSAVKELNFMAFINNMALISTLIYIVTIILLVFIYRGSLQTKGEVRVDLSNMDERKQIKNPKVLKYCLAVITATIVMFCFHQLLHLEAATVAMFGATALLLLTQKHTDHNLEYLFKQVEWVAIFFFVGLFILVGGLIETGIIAELAKQAIKLTEGDVATAAILILWMSAIASAFLDNIPFVATMIPLIKDMGAMGVTNLEPLWWSLALGACLGGNGTLVGASANVVVAGLAAAEGCIISFRGYFKIGFPLMIVSILMANVYIYLRYL